MHESAAAPTSAPSERRSQEPWRRRLVRTLLYGSNVDRAAKARARIGLAIVVFGICYAVIAGRLVMYAATDNTTVRRSYSADAVATARPDILDRNGEILATDVRTPSLFARAAPHHRQGRGGRTARHRDPRSRRGRSARAAVARGGASSGCGARSRRSSAQEIHRLGLPGIGFMHENKRVYPNGPLVSHLIGHVNIDNQGIAGIEKWLDSRGLADLHLAGLARDRLQQPVELAVDLRVQHAMRDELIKARDEIQGDGRGRPRARCAHRRDRLDGVGARLRSEQSARGARSDPHQPPHHRRVRDGLDLQGAHAGDGARFRPDESQLDVRCARPLQYGRHTINDYHGQKRMLSMPEVFTYSSNIGTARMALALGVEHHKAFLRKLGQLDRLRTELPESAEPIVPRRWGEINTVTIAFGHGLSVAPLQAMMANAALVNGGMLIPPTFRKRTEAGGDGRSRPACSSPRPARRCAT